MKHERSYKNSLENKNFLKKNKLNLKYLIVIFFPILLYIQTITFDYALDDVLMITSNEFTKKGVSGIKEIFTNDVFVGLFGDSKNLVAGGRYRPLTHAMFAIEYEIFGQNPAIGHLFNILFYALLSLVIYKTLNLMFKEPSKERLWFKHIPFIATLLFIAHPLHTEVIANIKGRDEIISMLGSMLALYFSIKFIETKKFDNLIYSFLSIILALFSKENAITFLGIVPLSLYFFTKATKRDYFLVMLPLILGSLIFIYSRYLALGFMMQNTINIEILNNPYINSSKAEELATTIFTWLVYLKLMIFPHPLTHDYYPWHLEIMNFSNPKVWFALAIILSIIIVAIKKLRQKHIISYGILFFIFTFSIQSNLVFNIGTFMNERFVFVAILGFCLIAAYLISQIKFLKDNNIKFLIILILTLYTAKTIHRTTAWKDNYTLFTTDVKTSKNSAKVNVSAAETLIFKSKNEKNKLKSEKQLKESLEYLNHAKNIHPSYYGIYDLSGLAYFYLGDYKESFSNYVICHKLSPEKSTPIDNIFLISQAAITSSSHEIAFETLDWLTKKFPDSLNFKFQLAVAYELNHEIDAAIKELEEIIKKDSMHYKAYSKLGEIFGKHKQNIKHAEVYLLKSHSIKADDLSTIENLGIIYGIQQNYQKSIMYFQKALDLDSSIPRIHYNIGNTYLLLNNQEKHQYHINQAKKLEAN